MKIKKNYFYLGRKKQYFIKLSDGEDFSLQEAKKILYSFANKGAKVVFTGFFRECIPGNYKSLLNFENFYLLKSINDVELILSNEFYNNIVNLSFYIFDQNIILNSNKDIEKYNALIYFENSFTDCGIIFDKTIYDEYSVIKKLS